MNDHAVTAEFANRAVDVGAILTAVHGPWRDNPGARGMTAEADKPARVAGEKGQGRSKLARPLHPLADSSPCSSGSSSSSRFSRKVSRVRARAVFIFQSVAITGILALGVTCTLVVGGFDLSIGSVATSSMIAFGL